MKYQHLTVGGTFDRFHKGHAALVTKAFSLGRTVWLGITTSAYLSTLPPMSAKSGGGPLPFAKRRQEVEEYLKANNWFVRAKIIPIDDKFGTTLTDRNLEAVVVSPETELTATEINLLRTRKNWLASNALPEAATPSQAGPQSRAGWPALAVIVVPWVLAEDGQPISTARIRKGEIDRQGRLYRLPQDWGVRRLPDKLRVKLRLPLGKLVSDLSYFRHLSGVSEELLITVGDVVTKNLLQIGVTPDISIVDLKVARQPVYKNVQDLGLRDIKVLKNAKNDAGTLQFEAYQALFSLIETEAKGAVLQIDGEEDLLTLLAILLAPLDSLIVYGQPTYVEASAGRQSAGIVVVSVTEEKKEEVREYLKQFIKSI